MRPSRLLAGVLSAGMVACTAPRAATDWALNIQPVPSPAAQHSGQPQLSVSGRGVLLSWVERAGPRATLKFAERTASGWSPARAVASGEDWFVNWADVPSVIRLADGSLAAHWLQKSGPGTYAYDVRLSYSTDGGERWSPSFTPHHDGTQTEHGFASLFEMPEGGLGVVWLDGRATTPEPHRDHSESAHGDMTVRFAAFDLGWKQTSDRLVDSRVCECCPTTAVVTADGPLAAFRNRSETEIRDIHVSRFDGGAWSAGAAVHDDGWQLPACPVNGPMLSARGRDVAIAWFTMQEGQGRAFAAFSEDAGRSFGPPIRLDDEASLGRVDIELLPDRSAIATWIEFADERAQLRVRRIEPSGTKSPASPVAGINESRASGYPRIARQGEELVFAWTSSAGGVLRVETAAARLPRAADSRAAKP